MSRGLAPDGSVSVRYLKQIHRYREQAPSHILIFIGQMLWRRRARSRSGGAPNNRLYSRLNCDGLSYPTRIPRR